MFILQSFGTAEMNKNDQNNQFSSRLAVYGYDYVRRQTKKQLNRQISHFQILVDRIHQASVIPSML